MFIYSMFKRAVKGGSKRTREKGCLGGWIGFKDGSER